MIEQIRENLYRIEIPLPETPLKATNAYFIRGTDKNLLIDNGFNHEICRKAMDQAIQELEFSMENTDIFVTHIHADHSGLSGYLARPETIIYTGEYTARLYQTRDFSGYFNNIAQPGGLLELGLKQDPAIDPGYRYLSEQFNNVSVVNDDTIIRVGDFSLQCFMTTGHAPDHVCLYDAKKQILFSGDHILGGITPNNTNWESPWTAKIDYLGEYFKSLAKIDELKIELTLPGHRGMLTNSHERIQELIVHHHNRLNHILEILGDTSMTAAVVASKMRWDLTIKSWDEFPMAQKLFATGEALSHLTHLVFQSVLNKYLQNGVVYYQKA